MEKKTLKEFCEEVAKVSTMSLLSLGAKLIELEAIENYLNLMFGIELEINVIATQKKEGRFYGKSLIEKISP